MFESVIEFLRSFADARKDHARRIRARFQHAEQLTTRNDIEPGARFGQEFQDGQVSVCFYRVTDAMRHIAEGLFVGAEFLENLGPRVNIAGRALPSRDIGQRHLFAVQRLISVLHSEGC